MSLKEKIQKANEEAIKRMQSAKIYLKNILPAKEVIKALNDPNKKLILVSGPPVDWKNMCGAQKGK